MTHFWWRHVLWSGRETTWSSIEVSYRQWCLIGVCTYVLRKGELLQCTKIGFGFDYLKECYLTKKRLTNFYCSLKVIEEGEQKRLIFEKIDKFCTSQATEIKQVKQLATLKYNYSSSQTVEFHPLLPASRYHSTLQP